MCQQFVIRRFLLHIERRDLFALGHDDLGGLFRKPKSIVSAELRAGTLRLLHVYSVLGKKLLRILAGGSPVAVIMPVDSFGHELVDPYFGVNILLRIARHVVLIPYSSSTSIGCGFNLYSARRDHVRKDSSHFLVPLGQLLV